MASFDEGQNTAQDDLFDYDAGLDELLRETAEQNTNGTENQPRDSSNNRKGSSNDADLGLDEEVKITRKRAPVAKLDENRLLSPAGIPKLRQTAKTKLKFKGKGHEFSDAARLLTFYQLWLDDLYPRAKFADALSIVEKLGHSKRMQMMRKEWIEEEKREQHPEIYEDTYQSNANGVSSGGAEAVDSGIDPTVQGGENGPRPRDSRQGDIVEHATQLRQPEIPSVFGEGRRTMLRNAGTASNGSDDDDLFVSDPKNNSKPADSVPEEDDLEALLAEAEQNERANGPNRSSNNVICTAHDENYDDDLEAMNL
ncbi:hypothetical protein VTO42DRAFT_8607 [Malbranchea cinnamomea]